MKKEQYNMKKLIRPFKKYKKGQIVYADLGNNGPGIESGIRPCMVISNSRSNHGFAPQVTVCPMTTKFKDNPVHVRIRPEDVDGYSIKQESELLPEQNKTIPKSAIRGCIGFTRDDSEMRYRLDAALIRQYGLLPSAMRMVKEELING